MNGCLVITRENTVASIPAVNLFFLFSTIPQNQSAATSSPAGVRSSPMSTSLLKRKHLMSRAGDVSVLLFICVYGCFRPCIIRCPQRQSGGSNDDVDSSSSDGISPTGVCSSPMSTSLLKRKHLMSRAGVPRAWADAEVDQSLFSQSLRNANK